MRFLSGESGAPEIPERLLADHEDGNVVFFCGAGISYPANLPGFKELVSQVYEGLGIHQWDPIQRVAFDNHQYDVAITLLESTINGGRFRVREQIAKLLCYPTISKESIMLHKALLTLAKNREGKIRLVTTNFDCLFAQAFIQLGQTDNSYIAPALPLINQHWDGLVYLHGLLKEKPELSENGPIVVSSGDFGQAYLVDRWAARFLGTLFQKYSICFIGYSLEDPVVRYMTDALAASKMYGGNSPEMYAFCGHETSNRDQIINTWKSKGITPIPYNDVGNHRLLQETMRLWGSTYADGWQGKISIIQKMVGTKPSPSTIEDDDVRKMVWAISDSTGKPAEIFARSNPVFDLSWLYAFQKEKYLSKDLGLFGIKQVSSRKFEDAYTLLYRPYADLQIPPTDSLVSQKLRYAGNDKVMNWIGRWLLRHLNNPNLLIWISESGGCLHPDFKNLIVRQLDMLANKENIGLVDDLAEIKKDSPDGIPDEAMRTLWELTISDRLSVPIGGIYLLQSVEYIKRNGLESSIKSKRAINPYFKPTTPSID